ncbi:hypothetical protein [Chitinophaga cymbidii]|uniref:hypothetical protein n=1 Tax=Chitinophaga cymbidii TaxID=1096750 RepID=UPI0011BEF913|nr:hypothetical protein [Chitinophaga cymbidii]
MTKYIIPIVTALLLLSFTGCKKDNKISQCFKLKVVHAYDENNRECSSNVFRVEESPEAEVAVGTYVTLTREEQDVEPVESGDVIRIKLLMKVLKAPGIDPLCPFDCTYHFHGSLCR